jgi:hypothetical protein
MKLKLLITSLILLTNLVVFGQKDKAELVFKDGNRIEGLAKLTKEGTIKFRKNRKEKKQLFTFKEVDTLFLENKTGSYAPFMQVKVKGQLTPKILLMKFTGPRLTCFEDYFMVYRAPGSANPGMGIGNFYTVTNSYFKKPNEERAVQLVNNNELFPKSFRKSASAYFEDCPDLAEKILKREFKQQHINEIVQYYNYQCK